MNDPGSIDILLKIVEIGSIIVGGFIAIFTLGRTASRFETQLTSQTLNISNLKNDVSRDILDLKDDVRALNKLLTEVAVQSTRLDALAERMNILDQRLEEARHGIGLVVKG